MKWSLAFSVGELFTTRPSMNLAIAPPANQTMNSQPELNLNPERPSEIITHNSDEFYGLCDRADRLRLQDGEWFVAQRGEFAIETLSIVSRHNGWYKVRVRWH